MIVFKGWGFVAAILMFAGLLIAQLAYGALSGSPEAYSEATGVMSGGFLLGGFLCFCLSFAIAAGRKHYGPMTLRAAFDPERVGDQSLFFIPIVGMPFVGIILAVVALIINLA